jgi:pimeloyl-ACP methyl ester carboxylesterase
MRLKLRKFSSNRNVLSHTVYSAGNPSTNASKTAMFMHGIVGGKNNWRTATQKFLALPGADSYRQAVTMEHRGHGASHGFPPPNTVAACADDLTNLLTFLNTKADLLCGHSFGGKVALKFLEKELASPTPNVGVPKHTWILDSLPGTYPNDRTNGTQSVFNILNILNNLPRDFANREEAVKMLTDKGVILPIAMWLGTSIVGYKTDDGTRRSRWSFDIDIINDLFEDFVQLDMRPFLEQFAENKDEYASGAELHYIRAGKNPMWIADDIEWFAHLESKSKGRIKLHTMEHVGHWLHTEDPDGTLATIAKFM